MFSLSAFASLELYLLDMKLCETCLRDCQYFVAGVFVIEKVLQVIFKVRADYKCFKSGHDLNRPLQGILVFKASTLTCIAQAHERKCSMNMNRTNNSWIILICRKAILSVLNSLHPLHPPHPVCGPCVPV